MVKTLNLGLNTPLFNSLNLIVMQL